MENGNNKTTKPPLTHSRETKFPELSKTDEALKLSARLRLRCCLGCFRLQRVLGGGNQLGECGAISGSQVRQDLSIQTNFGGLEAFHEAAIGQASGTRRSINANLPEHPKIPLLG